LQAEEWIRQIAINLRERFVITIDYEVYLSNELYSAERKSQALTCYHQHTVNVVPLALISGIRIFAFKFFGVGFGLKSMVWNIQGFCLTNYYFLHIHWAWPVIYDN